MYIAGATSYNNRTNKRTLPSVSGGNSSKFAGLVGGPRRRKTESRRREDPADAAIGGGAASADAMVKEYDGEK